MLQIAVFFLAFGNLLCGFAKTPVQLYIFRAISGMGGGGINGIAMVIVSDIVPLKDRGKYQGFISAACSTGSAIVSWIGHHPSLSNTAERIGTFPWRWSVFCRSVAMGLLVSRISNHNNTSQRITPSASLTLASGLPPYSASSALSWTTSSSPSSP